MKSILRIKLDYELLFSFLVLLVTALVLYSCGNSPIDKATVTEPSAVETVDTSSQAQQRE